MPSQIKLLIYYTSEAIIASGGKLNGVQTYYGNKTKKNDSQEAFNKDLQRLEKLVAERQGKFKAAIIYDLRGASGVKAGIPIQKYNRNGNRI